MSNALMLHCGAEKTTLKAVKAVVTPAATESHFPVAHGQLIDQLGNAIKERGFTVKNAAHSLAREGSRYFGLFEVESKDKIFGDDFGGVIGLRNSHDKRFSAGLTMGSQVFVCDNLAFNGDVKVGRKHTRHIERDLPRLMAQAFGKLTDFGYAQTELFNRFKETELTNTQANDLIIQAVDCKAVSASRIPEVLKQWRTPNHPEFNERTTWSLFNAFTEVYKLGSLRQTHKKSQRLTGLLQGTLATAA